MKQPTGKDWRALRDALERSGELQKCVQHIRKLQDRKTRLAQAEARRERDRAIRRKEGAR